MEGGGTVSRYLMAVPTRSSGDKIIVRRVSWWTPLWVRPLKVFLSTLIGYLPAVGIGAVPIQPDAFGGVFLHSVWLSSIAALMTLLTNALILVTKLDQSLPESMA